MTRITTVPVATLAAIIRQVDATHSLDAVALAEAILAHPASQWGPALPVPTDVELEADFRAWYKTRYDSDYFGGISLCDAIAWGKRLLQQSPQPAAPWPQLPREAPPEVLSLATFNACNQEDAAKLAWQCFRAEIDRQRIGQGLSVPEPASWPELPPQPPGSPSRTVNWRDLCAELLKGLDENRYEQVRYPGHLRIIMDQARTALQRLREQSGVAPTPVLAFPEISDQLIKSLIGDVLSVTGTATEQSCLNRYWNPVPEVRSRLIEILRLAAQDEAAERPTS